MKKRSKPIRVEDETEEFDGIEPGPAGVPYGLVWCPVKRQARQTLLCVTCCADASWSDAKVSEMRKQCPKWSSIRSYQDSLEDDIRSRRSRVDDQGRDRPEEES